jgi:hypothetical protein
MDREKIIAFLKLYKKQNASNGMCQRILDTLVV